jgi:hypothetical protein
MTYDEFTDQLERADIKVREFAQLIKRTPNAITNYAGKGEVPALIAIVSTLIAEMHQCGIDYRSTIGAIEFEGIAARTDGKIGFRGTPRYPTDTEGEQLSTAPDPDISGFEPMAD